IGAEYYFNDRNTLMASFAYNVGDGENTSRLIYNTYDENRTLNSVRLRDEFEKEDETEKEINLNYESKFDDEGRHKLTFILNYEEEEETEDATYVNDYIFGAGVDGVDTSLNNEGRKEFLFQGDYILPFNDNEGQFEAGYKSEINAISSEVGVTING